VGNSYGMEGVFRRVSQNYILLHAGLPSFLLCASGSIPLLLDENTPLISSAIVDSFSMSILGVQNKHLAKKGHSAVSGPGVFALDPLTDTRWDDLLDRHPRASVFHSRGWLEALNRTYGYEPVVLTTTERGSLANGLALCRVRTWMSRRLVSLPFSDHCEPLVDRSEDLSALVEFLAGEVGQSRWSSLDLRPREFATGPKTLSGLAEGPRYYLHILDLAWPAERIFHGFHHSSTQRAIRRAEREDLSYEVGTSESLLSTFYALLRLTRRRHGLPPQPLEWFRNLVACLGDRLAIHVARKNGQPIASILTLSFKKTMVYKYGGSDAAHHRLGGMPFLFWRAIQEAQQQGMEQLDLGRSDLNQSGLIAFKDHLGATRSLLTYYTCPERTSSAAHDSPLGRAARRVVAQLPDRALDLAGRLLYKHLG
jgi:CelD/BcsL family acetyltransferase involved in cellulose biosynthesis